MRPPLRGICFDLWNTLAATSHDPHPLEAMAEAFGLIALPDWRRTLEQAFMTRPLPGISAALEALEKMTGRAPSGRWSRRDLVLLWGAASNGNAVFREVPEALRRLRRRGYRLAIVSNTQSFDLDFLHRAGIPSLLDDLCLSCSCGFLKPDPAIFHAAAGRLGLPPAAILMVGDRLEDDVLAARAAGLRGALLVRGVPAPPRAPQGVAVVHDLAELADRLERGEEFISPS